MQSLRRGILILVVSSMGMSSLIAEPWLGNRFAQNCAGCHAPGRKNLAPIDRRCTLSCQGCHVNPNGGGLRSFYGKWNQDRWLRSYRTKWEPTTKSFAPSGKQEYGKTPYAERSKKGDRWIYDEGYNLIESEVTTPDERLFDRSDRLEQKKSEAWKEFLYQIPQEDPYRDFERSRVDAGGDVRWMWRRLGAETNSSKEVPDSAAKWQSFLMSFDAGIRWRPVHRNLHFVYEGRMFGTPNPDALPRDSLATSGTRSLYAMVDNLPFNTFVMGGYYRPLIGTSSADHNALPQRMISSAILGTQRAQSMLFEAISIGTAPNVPFANIHYIKRKKVIGGDIDGDRTQGFAINGGLRFVTLGAAVNGTYWRTDDDNKLVGEKTLTEIASIGASARLGRLISGVEFLSITRDSDLTDYRRGGVVGLETKFQLWRENYLFADLAYASTTADLLPGKATQAKLGLRAFHFSGFETMISYDIDQETSDGEKNTAENKHQTSYLTGQVHVFF